MLYKLAAGILLLFGGIAVLCVGVGYAGYAIYAALTPEVGTAGAAGITSALFLLFPIIAWVILWVKGLRRRAARRDVAAAVSPEAAVLSFLSGLAKDRPLVGIALAGLAGAGATFLRRERDK